MDIITKIREKFIDSSLNIDELITNYLMKRLGVNNIETINAISNDGKLTFNKRLDLLLQIKTPTNIDAAKIKVYREVYDKILNSPYIKNYTQCFDLMPSNAHFLTIIYPQKEHFCKEEQLEMVTNSLLNNVELIIAKLTKIHTINIIDDVEEENKPISLFNRKFISNILRRAMF